jgi:hypothetical protein
MDHSKVNGLSVPSQAHATAAQPPLATQAATDRFSRAMGEPTVDTPSPSGWVRGTTVRDPINEPRQDNREQAYRRWQAPAGSGVMGAVSQDMAADSSSESKRTHIEPAAIGFGGSGWTQLAVANQARGMAAPRSASGAELTQMLERMCSALYVGDKSVSTQRLVMALDHVLPGAAAEIVREGVHLSIRLHARTEESFRSMSSQRDELIRALNGNGERRVEVQVVHGDPQGFGDSRG